MTSADRASIERLTAINVEDFLDALGVSRGSMARPLLAALCRPLARRFAGDVLTYDAVVGEKGLAAGGEWASRAYVKGWAVSGAEKVPREGPLLAVSNHPGLYDAVLIFASLGRDDLKVIAAE